jgi:hypothetical protein
MSLRLPDRDRTSAASLAFGVHCSVFKKRFSDGAPGAEAGEHADVEATRTRSEAANDLRFRALVSNGSTVPGHM